MNSHISPFNRDPAGHLVVAVITLLYIIVGVECLPHEVGSRAHVSDIDPLAVQITRVAVSTVGGYPLWSCRGAAERWGDTRDTLSVLKTERGLVTLGNFHLCVRVQKVKVYKSFKGVVVIMAGVPYPVLAAQVRVKGAGAPVMGHTVEAQEFPVYVDENQSLEYAMGMS